MRRSRITSSLFLLAFALGCTADAPTGVPATATAISSADREILSGKWSANGHSGNAGGNKLVTVMTRNMYLGASFDAVIGAPAPAQIPAEVARVWATVQASNPPERVAAIAEEIAAAGPKLVGLQEVALWRVQTPGDFALGNPSPATTPVTAVVFDFLQLLVDDLAARGLKYEAVSVSTNFDAELFSATGIDVRYTDRDVILARKNVKTFDARHGTYAAKLTIPIGGAGGPTVTIPRGWTSTDVKYKGETFRFFNTHLEIEAPPFGAVQVLQGLEAIQLLNASPLPVIAVGDFNSAADGSTTATYGNLIAAGYQDAWSALMDDAPGYTSSQAEDLRNPSSLLYQRVDFVLWRGPIQPVSIFLVGEDPSDRTASGLWPSDHAGVVATLRLLKQVGKPVAE